MNSQPAAESSYLNEEVKQRIERCPKLASLDSINRKLAGLVNSDHSYTAQIAETIRRDPSLTARLLRMVNSVYFGLSAKVNNIEEAVLYLGMRQIKELSMATPVIDDMERMSSSSVRLPWRELWQHSIGTAIMTRKILGTTNLMIDDDTDYIIGLLHNVGKVVMAMAWPDVFKQLVNKPHASPAAVCTAECMAIGWDHAQVGGYYLERHHLPPEIVQAILHHAHPRDAGDYAMYAAAIQVGDLIVREAGIPSGFEKVPALPRGAWRETDGWKILFPDNEKEEAAASASLVEFSANLPAMLRGMV